jgi:wyosine [tRNA(Phe)-imidazoG37] synthetase (radical SAM superfamily)
VLKPLKDAFSDHPRRWRAFRYVYPVIARRSRGLSIGVNLNPDGACNFDCIYCSVDRAGGARSGAAVDPAVLEAELRHIVVNRVELFDEPEFRQIPPEFRRLNDIAFSGDGEATAVPIFPQAVRIAAAVRRDFQLDDVKIVVITNAGYLTRPAVVETLAFLDQNNGEIWAKLDAGTEEYYRRVNRPNFPLQHVLDNILATARVRPIVVQSLFMRIQGEPPPAAEIAAYVDRLRWLLESGARVALVQVYTVARRTAESYVTPLTADELEQIAAAVRPLGVPVAVFP